MSVKQIRWQGVALVVTVIAVMAALFALATVTSNAAEVIKEKDAQGNWTYILNDSTYAEEIILDANTTTTLVLSGENKLTFGSGDVYSDGCIAGQGDLRITGDGTLDIPGSRIICSAFTMDGGAKLTLYGDLYANKLLKMDNADIEVTDGQMYCGAYYGTDPQKHVFNNAQIKITKPLESSIYYSRGLFLIGESSFTNCNVTLENSMLSAQPGEITIDGGTYTFIQTDSNLYPYQVYAGYRAKIKNAVIKASTCVQFQNLEMSDSTLEITVPSFVDGPYGEMFSALNGDNLVFTGSKVKTDGAGYGGLTATNQLIITGNTEMDIKAKAVGIVGANVNIRHSGGTFQITDPAQAIAAVASLKMESGTADTTPGTITLTDVSIKEPADGAIGEVTVKIGPNSYDPEATITVIKDGDAAANTVVLENGHTTHTWDDGKVTQEPTETAEGVKTYTCTVCGATKTEAIPKLTPQDSQGSKDSQGSATGADGTPFGKGASVAAAEAAILALPNDNDPAGTAFGLLQLKASKVTKNSINLKWKAVPGASKYILFANKCGTGNKYKKLGEVTGTSYTATQAAGAAIQKGTYYKFMMIAADSNGKVISTSKTVHAATKGGKIGNHKKVTVKKSVTKKAKKLKKGKTLKLKAKAVPQAKKLKVRKHRGIMYETSNPAVAQVNGKGTVKGVGKGTCYIYAYAQNGTCAKVKVTVK